MATNPEYDIIIVGAGAAGMPAALFASESSAKILLIEAAPEIGGTFFISSGQMSASGTRLQAEKGIEDNPDKHFADVMRINNNTANPELVRLAVDNAADTLHWLVDSGLVLEPHHPIIHPGHEPYQTARTYWAPEGGLAVLKVIRPLIEKAEAEGKITIRTSTRLKELLTEDGAVVGVKVTNSEGAIEDITAREVILTTGGYTANPELFKDLSMGRTRYGGGYDYSRGDGFIAATAVGAAKRGDQQFLPTFAGVREPSAPGGYAASTETYPEFRVPWEVYVDLEGRRFMREDEPSVDTRERKLLELPEMRFWAIYDTGILNGATTPFIVNATPEEAAKRFETNPAYIKADTLEELAEKTGMNADVLKKSVEEFNDCVVNGKPDPFGREHRPLPVVEGPFYAIEHVGWSVVGFAGIAIDTEMRVLKDDGTAIPGLFAAGEVIGLGQTSGNAFCGGMSVTPAMTFGRLIGQSRAKAYAGA